MPVDKAVLDQSLSVALKSGGDYADIFVERKRNNGLRLEDGKLESFSTGADTGAGLRVILGEATYFVHTDSLDSEALLAAAAKLAEAVRANNRSALPGQPTIAGSASAYGLPASGHKLTTPAEKAEIVRRAEQAAREPANIAQVTVMLADSVQDIEILTSEGIYATDHRLLTRIFVLAVAKKNGITESAHEAPGITGGYELFKDLSPESVGRKAAEKAAALLDAKPAPAGAMPVVLGNGTGGVLFHEACGHGLEADAIRKGASVFAGQIGKKVAAACVSAADDPSLPGRWGSFGIDDEGVPARENLLIEDGILRGFIYDRFTAGLAGARQTPNGRRQSYRHVPIPRMTNTYIKAGKDAFEDMIAGVKRGLYAKSLGGGEVDPATGDYVFGVTEGYLIENGVITAPVRGAVLVGNGPQTLKDIDMVGADVDFDAGMCGKDGQSVPAGTGQPSLRVKKLTVGGTG